jgi:outer membrane protein
VKLSGLCCLAAGLLLWTQIAGATEPQPQLEAGIGLIELTRPNYRGSDHYSSSVLPLPYVIYRGDRVKITREGVKARLFNLDSLNVGLSSAFNLTGSSDDPARRGMPELRSTLEIGPSLDWRGHSGVYTWCLCAPIRFVTATDLRHYNAAGWVTHPHFKLARFGELNGWDTISTFSIGPVWATRKYHAYFYEVAPQYATPDRPAFSAGGGYSGARASLYFGLSRGHWRGGIGLLNDWLGGAAFADSPLVKTRNATVIGIGMSYQLWSRGATTIGEETP